MSAPPVSINGAPPTDNVAEAEISYTTSLILCALVNFVAKAQYGVIMPSVWLYLESFGATESFLGIVVSVFSLMRAIAMPIVGIWADKRTYKEVFIVTTILGIIGNLVYATASTKYYVLFGRIIVGISAANAVLVFAYAAQVSSPETRTGLMMKLSVLSGLAMLFGPVFNLGLSQLNFQIVGRYWVTERTSPGYFSAALWVIVLILTVPFLREPPASFAAKIGSRVSSTKSMPDLEREAKMNKKAKKTWYSGESQSAPGPSADHASEALLSLPAASASGSSGAVETTTTRGSIEWLGAAKRRPTGASSDTNIEWGASRLNKSFDIGELQHITQRITPDSSFNVQANRSRAQSDGESERRGGRAHSAPINAVTVAELRVAMHGSITAANSASMATPVEHLDLTSTHSPAKRASVLMGAGLVGDEENEPSEAVWDKIRSLLYPHFMVMLYTHLVLNFNVGNLETIVTPVATQLFGFDSFTNSLIFCYISVIVAVSFLLLSLVLKLRKHTADRSVIMVGLVFSTGGGVAMMLVWNTHMSLAGFLLPMGLLMTGNPLVAVANRALFSKKLKGRQAFYQSLLSVMMSGGTMIGSLWGGLALKQSFFLANLGLVVANGLNLVLMSSVYNKLYVAVETEEEEVVESQPLLGVADPRDSRD